MAALSQLVSAVSVSYDTLIALESLAAMSCTDQKKFKSLSQVSRLSPAGNNIDDEIAIVLDASNSRHLGSHPGKY